MGAPNEEHSEPLLASSPRSDSIDDDDTPTAQRQVLCARCAHEQKHANLFAAALWFAGSLLFFASTVLLYPRSHPRHPEIYTPVKDHIRYQTVVFDPSSPHAETKSIYMQDPSPAVDRAWADLYDFGLTWLTPTEAAHLPNATSRLPSHPSHFVSGLDVFHQLQCLDFIRKKLDPGYYVNDTQLETAHCVDQIRQSLMCAADAATIPWSWSQSRGRTVISVATTHTCRDFEAIREWAVGRRVEGAFDKEVWVEGSAVSE